MSEARASRWEEIPLSTRLVTTFVVLLSFGLFVAFVATSSLIRSSLVAQLDHHLATTADSLSGSPGQWLAQAKTSDSSLPSQYYIQLDLVDGRSRPLVSEDVVEEFGSPLIESPNLTAISPATQAFTVPNRYRGAAWRVYQAPIMNQATKTPIGIVSVALPTASVLRPLEDSLGLLVATSVLLLLIGGLVSWVAIRRALSPLREIEATAGAIAAGDLSRRIRTRPPTTEVGSLAQSLNSMLAQIEQAFSDRMASEARTRQFISDASHELRTPVATIRGYAELYRMGGIPDAEVGDAIRRIEAEAGRMGDLVSDLLQLARLDEGRRLAIDVFDLRDLANDAAKDLTVLDHDRPVAVISLTGEEPGETLACADPDKIRQLLANLTGNVIHHTPKGTAVELAVGIDGERAVVEVRDHGPGVPQADAAQIFRRFYRVDTSRARTSGGSGLGLAIVAAIVEAHNGEIAVRETDGGGLTVRVELPKPNKAGVLLAAEDPAR
ncbi:MAG: HAMP domain-containing sensor histidine kinase [Bowdeniella nasicola]|nr:HAMP domain-containing sensor histidine kinase [Bowdeniella nasicola]